MKLLLILGLLSIVPLACAQSNSSQEPSSSGSGVFANFETTMGNFRVRLFEDEAPRTVENFVGLATGTKEWEHPDTNEVFNGTPLYSGVLFHRVISGFMIQGGDPAGTGFGGPGYRFDDEFSPNLSHSSAGILSMANAGPNTNGSQFFITLGPTPHLDGRHSVFGEVVDGMDIISAIGAVPTGPSDRPVEDVVINQITIERLN